jgi:hypothetical protein
MVNLVLPMRPQAVLGIAVLLRLLRIGKSRLQRSRDDLPMMPWCFSRPSLETSRCEDKKAMEQFARSNS